MKFLCIALLLVVDVVRSCNHDKTLKDVGQSCKADSECYSGGSTDAVSCKSGLCTCNDGYFAQMQWFAPNDRRMVCLPAPYQDQACTNICQKPLTCANSSTPGMKTCQCLPPAKVKDGLCYLECRDDEAFEGGECRKRCDFNENRHRYICKKVGKLGEECSSKDLCSAPYSQCINGVCACPNGFVANTGKDACESSNRWCPIGNAIRTRDGKFVECKVSKRRSMPDIANLLLPFPTPQLLEDNCGANQFCMLTSGDGFYAEGAVGHCCPKPKLRCPYGQPHPNATCGQTIPSKTVVDLSSGQYCPYGSHSCVRFSFGGGFEESMCCPTACGSSSILSGGKCYPRRNLGDKCQVNEQCRGHMGFCEKGKCTCGRDYLVDGNPSYFYCRKGCKSTEILVDSGRCLPILKLGDKCDPAYSSQCPTNSYCSPERKVCDCFCGYVKLSADACGPQPTCPDIMASRDTSVLDAAINLDNLTLCRARDTPKEALVSDTCPSGKYCSSYVQRFGICCPQPEKPFCPNGAAAGEKCDPQDTMPCGPLGYCYRYLNPANDEGVDSSVCCSVLPGPGLPSLPMPPTPMNQTNDIGQSGNIDQTVQ